ncbi:YkgJ family cysteine cluster protein [Thermodesulfobacteriota bacterium]
MINTCQRCGTCCRKGGPALHLQDKRLIEKGVIPVKHLYTIRKGELVQDNVVGRLEPVSADLIKIKGRGNEWTCRFFEDEGNICRIYQSRPTECRVLKCWDIREIEQLYAKARLSRKDILANINGLWHLIGDHEKRCSYEKIRQLLGNESRKKGIRNILEMIRYDDEMRVLVVEKSGLDPGMLDFLFGRPLLETIHMFGLHVGKEDGHYLA